MNSDGPPHSVVGDSEMVGVDMLFFFEIECGHGKIPLTIRFLWVI